MPVVRELVNLFSFDTDQQSLSKADAKFKGLAKTAAGIGVALVGGLSAATLKMIPAIEKANAEIKFFGGEVRSIQEDLDKRKAGGFFSITELKQVRAELAPLAVRSDQITKSISILQDVTRARGFNKSLKESGELLKSIVKDGDALSIRDLGGFSKELAEQVSRTRFSEAFQTGTEESRLELLLKIFEANRANIKELAKTQDGSLTSEIERFNSSVSDLSLKTAESFKDTMKEAFKFANLIVESLIKIENLDFGFPNLFKELNSSPLGRILAGESFEKVTKERIRELSAPIVKIVSESASAVKGTASSTLSSTKSGISSGISATGGVLSSTGDAAREGLSGIKSGADIVDQTLERFVSFVGNAVVNDAKSLFGINKKQSSETQNVKIEVSGDIKINSSNGSLSPQESKAVGEKMVDGLKNTYRQLYEEAGGADSSFTPAGVGQ